MRGYILPTVIALLLAAPLLWRLDTELTAPNQAVGVVPSEEAELKPDTAISASPQGIRLLAAVPLTETPSKVQVELDMLAPQPDREKRGLWFVGFSPSGPSGYATILESQ